MWLDPQMSCHPRRDAKSMTRERQLKILAQSDAVKRQPLRQELCIRDGSGQQTCARIKPAMLEARPERPTGRKKRQEIAPPLLPGLGLGRLAGRQSRT